MNGNKIKLLAITLAALMLAGGLVFLVPADESDATDGVLEALYPGSWTWDRTTGLGPFNSFYAAFDMTNGNAFYAVLNPYDLTKTVGGDSLSPMSNYNIMWVIPTVYWKATGNTLTITNDSTAGGTAYAHTIDSHVYNYIAIGVYHGAKKTVGGVDVLTSESGVAATVSQTRAVFRDQANNYTMDSSLGADAHSMLWNFDMWTLYKLCCYAVMEDFNSQATVGNGNVNGGNYTKVSGSLNTYGPYAGNNGDLGSSGSGASTYGQQSTKLFIEDSWGTVCDFVDGVICSSSGYYIDRSSIPTDTTTTGGSVEYVNVSIPSYNWGTAISTNERVWGVATTTTSTNSYNVGMTDKFGGASSNSVLTVGGASNTVVTASVNYGVSYVDNYYNTSSAETKIGSRLALVFDAGPAAMGGSSYSYDLVYDPTAMATTSAAISVEGMDPITHDAPPTVTATIESNNTSYGTVSNASIVDIEPGTAVTISQDGLTLTIGAFGSSVATPTTSDAQYTYALSGWYVNNVALQTGDTIDSDVTIEARFTATLNTYTVTISPNDPTYGSLSSSSVSSVPYGTHLSILDNVITINGTDVTATPADATAQYTFSFGSWSVADDTEVTGDLAVTAVFSATVNTYTVTIESNDVDKGTVSPSTISDVPYGTEITVDGSKISVGAVEVTTTAASGFELKNWSVRTGDTITGDTTITATFDEPKDVNNILLKLIPLILIIALVVLAATAMFSFNGDGQQLIRFIIVLGICVVLITTVLIPAVGGI